MKTLGAIAKTFFSQMLLINQGKQS